MKELIKEAEGLYDKLYKLQKKLSLNNDDKETLIKTRCFLRSIVDRKDNIVDLGEVWHSIDVEPQKGSWFVGQIGEKAYDTFVAEIEGERMKDWLEGCNIKRWAYIKDLLPKGGKE